MQEALLDKEVAEVARLKEVIMESHMQELAYDTVAQEADEAAGTLSFKARIALLEEQSRHADDWASPDTISAWSAGWSSD